ncbi:MAG TPA: FG-GAP-like repeat-containing protein, partial [Luteitalea sp.]|nr:FG-GAP-like repeat-containing protein [Luteitalea sp.]
MMRRLWYGTALVVVCLASAAACRRTQDVAPEVYREAVVAFHTALAAIDTSQELLAREKLDRVVALVPQEPAGWANLGLLLLRQQETTAAKERLDKAAALAPQSAAIARLQALAASREGDLAASTRLWQRAAELDPADPKAAYALAQETERQGGPDHEAEAQRILEGMLARADNLPVRLDYARLAAKRGDATALARALAPLTTASSAWPEAARERLAAVQAAASTPRTAATQVAFLRNVLARDVTYRRALAQVTTPLDAVGEPLTAFLVLPAPTATPAAPDTGLRFTLTTTSGWPAGLTWAGATALGTDTPDTLMAADHTQVLVGAADRSVGSRGAGVAVTGGRAVIVAADLNYDFRTDLIRLGPNGLTFLSQAEGGTFTDTTTATGLPGAVTGAALRNGWPADVDLDGDLDLVIAPVAGEAFVLRNNGDGTFVQQQPFGPCASMHGFAWADVDGEGVPDAACLDATGAVRIFVNLRGGSFEAATVPIPPAALQAIAAADVTADGRADVVGVTASGLVVALSATADADGAARLTTPSWQWREMGRVGSPIDPDPTTATRLLLADLDNNGALDVVVSSRQTHLLLAGDAGTFTPLAAPITMDVETVADLDDDGR